MNSQFEENSQHKENDESVDLSGDVMANSAVAPVDPKLAGGFDLSEDDLAEINAFDERRASSLRRAAYQAWKDKERPNIEESQRAGHKAQEHDKIDAHRKTPEGKADYNANRQKKRLKDAEEAGRTIKPRNSYETPEESASAHAGAKRAYKDRRKAEFALLSPDQQQAIRDEEAKKKRDRRERKKTEATRAEDAVIEASETWRDRAIF